MLIYVNNLTNYGEMYGLLYRKEYKDAIGYGVAVGREDEDQ